MDKINKKVHVNYIETDELRGMYIQDLENIPDLAVKAMNKNKMFTVGDVLDKWEKLSTIKGIGSVRIRHVKAAIFAQICEMGLLKKADLIEEY